MFTDASHADDLVTRLSRSGIIIFIVKSPIIWYTKKQNTIEISMSGSEFAAGKTGAELNRALRYKVIMFGIDIDGPKNTFMDNQSVVYNTTLLESTLKRKHNAI